MAVVVCNKFIPLFQRHLNRLEKGLGNGSQPRIRNSQLAFVHNTTTEFSITARLRAFVAQASANWAMNREYKRTYTQLSRLTNRELADIGVRRCDIADIARKHVHNL